MLISPSLLGRYGAGIVAISAVLTASVAMHHRQQESDHYQHILETTPNRTVTESLSIGGITRTYNIHVPIIHDRNVPLVVAFTDGPDTSTYIESSTGFSQLADSAGFIVVYPQSLGSATGGMLSAADSPEVELSFVRELLDVMDERFEIDPSRIYAAGIAKGALFARQLACAGDDQFAAIGAIDAEPAPTISASVSDSSFVCEDSTPLVALTAPVGYTSSSAVWSFFATHAKQ